jgi:hypothetical protein
MKRFVCVPSSMGGVPDEATRLSEESQLSIRIEEDIDNICIKSFPEDDFADCMDEVKAGFIHIVDITNEFVDFPRNTHMVVTDLDSYSQAIKPMVITNHSLRFRSRFYTLGLHKFSIVDNNDGMYYQGEFIVI